MNCLPGERGDRHAEDRWLGVVHESSRLSLGIAGKGLHCVHDRIKSLGTVLAHNLFIADCTIGREDGCYRLQGQTDGDSNVDVGRHLQ